MYICCVLDGKVVIFATTHRDVPYQMKVWFVYCTKLKVETTGSAETTEPV